MKIKFFQTCRVSPETAGLYIYYCNENDIHFEAVPDGPSVCITFYETQENLEALNKWILKTLYY